MLSCSSINLVFNLNIYLYDKFVTSQSSSLLEAIKMTCSSSSLDEGSSKILLEVDYSRSLLDVESLKILLIEASFSFLLSNILWYKTYSYSLLIEANILDEFSPLDVESSKDHSSRRLFFQRRLLELIYLLLQKNSLMKLLKILLELLNSFLHFITFESTRWVSWLFPSY